MSDKLHVITQSYPLWVTYYDETFRMFNKPDREEIEATAESTDEDLAGFVYGPFPIIGWEYQEGCVPRAINAITGESEGKVFIADTPLESYNSAMRCARGERDHAIKLLENDKA